MCLLFVTTFFHKWASFGSAITGFFGAVLLAISNVLIPWGLRLPKNKRHPFQKRPAVNNSSNQSTTSQQEWWGEKFRNFGWMLLIITFVIQIIIYWP